ncbi:hypothetical protein ACH4SP_03985 [Streptomyces sp. NPDC021093]|uniref:hypothetical protein n=1 Tax=Streptomyces sp. NPDC021093 TaxID=3365112 RepID=UPI0037A29F4B
MTVKPVIEEGRYFLKCNGYPDRVADLSEGNVQPNTPVVGWEWSKADNQIWVLTSVNNFNLYYLQSASGDAYLGTSVVPTRWPRVTVQEHPQTWAIDPAGPGTHQVTLLFTDLRVSLPSEQAGTQLVLQDDPAPLPHQCWRFERVS